MTVYDVLACVYVFVWVYVWIVIVYISISSLLIIELQKNIIKQKFPLFLLSKSCCLKYQLIFSNINDVFLFPALSYLKQVVYIVNKMIYSQC